MKQRIWQSLTLLAVLLASALLFGADAAKATDDPVLRSLQTELQRNKTQLKLDANAAPYFIDYRVLDMDAWEADAALGALRSESRRRICFLMVQVRVGDYKQDNSSARGDVTVELVPLDKDDQAFRFQVWSATDKAYKQALEAFSDKQARLKQLTIDHPVDDFAVATPVQSLHATVKLQVEREPWLKMLRDASAVYRDDVKVQFLSTTLSFRATNRYYVNSEGAAVRDGQTVYFMTVAANTQAADGMTLERSNSFEGVTLAEMPTAEAFVARARALVASLKSLREAPLADEEYHGPVLLSADAAATVFSSLVGNNVLGNKPDLGQNARVRNQFASSYKTRVLPEFLSVVDDPALEKIGSETLLGHYTVDDEGVQAQRVPVVEKGVLVNYLLGRQPIRDFPASNGHSRVQSLNAPGPAMGNLVVSATGGVAAAELKQKLIAMCKERGLEFGYYVQTMAGFRMPRLLYRVWVKDGREELVRGGVFGDLDQRSMRSNIVAAGNDGHVENSIRPYLYTVVAPSVLLDDLEVKRQTTNKDKLPVYPSPEEAAAAK